MGFMKKMTYKEVFVVVYLLHIIRLYYFLPYSALHNMLTVLDICFAFFFFVCFVRCKKNNCLFEKSTTLLYLIFCFSFFVGLKNGQEIDRLFKYTSSVFLQFGFYYYLKCYKIDLDFLQKVLKYLLIGYVVVSVFCYLQYPNLWFGGNDEQSLERMKDSIENRGIVRVSLPCKMLIPLFLFSEAQYVGTDKGNKLHLFCLLFLFILVANRFPLVMSILVLAYMLLASRHIRKIQKLKIAVTVSLLGILLFCIPLTSNIINSLVDMTKTERQAGDENNIRVLAATYFFKEFNAGNPEAVFIGNGIASNGSDSYSRKIKYLNTYLGYWESDVGFCEIYIYFGILGLVALLFWCWCLYKTKVRNEYKYIKYYFLFLILAMICGGYWFENLYIVNILSYILVNNQINKRI